MILSRELPPNPPTPPNPPKRRKLCFGVLQKTGVSQGGGGCELFGGKETTITRNLKNGKEALVRKKGQGAVAFRERQWR